jgi:hypothetical protein
MTTSGAGGEVLELLVSWIVTTALTFVIVIADERRLSPARLERAWLPSSRDAAIVAFGILSLPVHFAKTRGSSKGLRGRLGYLAGFAMGIVAIGLVAVGSTLALTAFDALRGTRSAASN